MFRPIQGHRQGVIHQVIQVQQVFKLFFYAGRVPREVQKN